MSTANTYAAEGTLAATTGTVEFPWPAREVQIINDSTQFDLQFRFNPTETYLTVGPQEVVSMEDVRIVTLYINSAESVPYRIWGLG